MTIAVILLLRFLFILVVLGILTRNDVGHDAEGPMASKPEGSLYGADVPQLLNQGVESPLAQFPRRTKA